MPVPPVNPDHEPVVLGPAARSSLVARLADLQSRTGVPALAYAMFSEDADLLVHLGGWRDREAALPVTEDTLFGVASVTKSFTALAVQTLVRRGLLALTDPVDRYLPFTLWRGATPPTLEHFLNHTSGLPPLPTMTWLRGPTQAGDPVTHADAELVERMAAELGGTPDVGTYEGLVAWMNDNVELLGPPGRTYSYSNDAFCLAGAVVERVSGRSFADYVAAAVLEPLGMNRSTFELPRVLADADRSTLYARDSAGAVQRSPAWEDAGIMRAGGALKSTLSDLRRYIRFLMEPTRAHELGLQPDDVRRMGRGTAWSGVGLRYGLGLIESRSPSGAVVVGHDGGLKGVSSRVCWLPGPRPVGVVVLTNLAGVPVDLLATAGLNAITGMPVGAPVYDPGDHDATADDLARIVGSYCSGEPYGRVRLYLRDGALRAAVGSPEEDLPARLVGADEIAVTGVYKRFPITTVLDDDGGVRGVFYGSRVLLRDSR